MSSDDTSTGQGPKLGEICWLEIPVLDSARAIAFYTAIFDWECDARGVPGPLPTIKQIDFFRKGSLNGAFATVDPKDLAKTTEEHSPSKQSVIASFAVPNVQETLDKVEKAGGKVLV